MKKETHIRSAVQFVFTALSPAARQGLVGVMVTIGMGAGLNALIPVLLGDLASSAESATRVNVPFGLPQAWHSLLWIAGCFLGRELAQLARKYVVHRITTTAERDAASRLVEHLLHLDLAALREFKAGALQGRIRQCLDGYVRLLKLAFIEFAPAILTAVCAVIVALSRNASIGGLILLSLPFLSAAVFWQIHSQKGIRAGLLQSKEGMEATIAEQLAGIEYIRTAHTLKEEVQRVTRKAEELRAIEMQHHVSMALFDFAKAMIESFFFVAVVGLAIWLAGRGQIAVGEIITSSMLFASVLNPFREIHRILDEAAESAQAVTNFEELMKYPYDSSFSESAAETGECRDGNLAVVARGMTVKYGQNGALPSLVDFAVEIPEGQIVGIVGKTGSGKSTFLRALLRLVHFNTGELRVCGHPIQCMDRAKIRDTFGVVSQHPFLRSGSLRENVAYGNGTASDADLQRAVELAALHDDLRVMEEGFETELKEGGSNLSGGQRQRVAIARAFIQAKPVMIFDEATSALDNLSEARVLQSIMQLRGQATVLMVAHRLTTLRNVDRVLVFSDGRIIEDGTYDELLALGGHFTELVSAAEMKNVE